MKNFFSTVFGSLELEIVDAVLEEWREPRFLGRTDPDVELAAAILMSLFREGHSTRVALRKAAARHKWLSEHSFKKAPTYNRQRVG